DVCSSDLERYNVWRFTNVFEQKQKGYYGVYVKVLTGDIPTEKARRLVEGIQNHVADDIRITQNQNLLFKFVREESLPHLFNLLTELGDRKSTRLNSSHVKISYAVF